MPMKTILKLMDVRTLVASLLPVAYGSAVSWYAYGKFNFAFFCWMLLGLFLIQSATNMFNDYNDFKRGLDTQSKGDEKALGSGEIELNGVLKLAVLYYLLAIGIGIYLSLQTGLGLLGVLVVATCAIYFYSAGPYPICYSPFGEITAGLTMGLGIVGSVIFLHVGQWHWQILFWAIPSMFYIALLLLANNLSDWNEDKAAGRKTLVILFGTRFGAWMWIGLVLGMYGSALVFSILQWYPWLLTGILWLTFPLRWVVKMFYMPKVRESKPVLMQYANLTGLHYHLITVIFLIVLAAQQS